MPNRQELNQKGFVVRGNAAGSRIDVALRASPSWEHHRGAIRARTVLQLTASGDTFEQSRYGIPASQPATKTAEGLKCVLDCLGQMRVKSADTYRHNGTYSSCRQMAMRLGAMDVFPSFGTSTLFSSQGLHWIDPRRSPCRNQAGQRSNGHQHCSCGREGRRIERLGSIEH